jgi:hypothetical protein
MMDKLFCQTQIKNMSSYPLTGWHNSGANPHTGKGYGLRIGKYRDVIDRSWKSVILLLHNGPQIEVGLKKSFWNKCPEFTHPEIGQWMLSLGVKLPWPHRHSPRFTLQQIRENSFRVVHVSQSA